jgi:signal transduction histidine kinase
MNKTQSIEQKSLTKFRVSLLSAILLSASVGALFVGVLASLDFLGFKTYYVLSLFGYGALTLCAYILLKKNQKYYVTSMYIGIFSSLILFTLMLLSVVSDELRLIWFFLVAFSAFILGRKRFGVSVTLLIVVIVVSLYFYGNIGLSLYALLTFLTALFMFTLFAFYFLLKIENDSALLKHRVEVEVAKQQAQEQIMLRKYRMASMGEMIDAIAHQWRQPLAQANMILLSIDDSIEDDNIDKTVLGKHLTELFGFTAHMSQTIDDFRTLLASDKPKQTFYIEESITEVLALMKGSLKDVDVEVNLDNKTEVFTHKNELMQVLITLLSNSIEAVHTNEIEDKYIAVDIVVKTETVTLTVEDNAGGIPEAIEAKIFDPYFTTKKSDGGTGLGLYIVKIIVEVSMQGRITQKKGKEGAKFSITLEREG